MDVQDHTTNTPPLVHENHPDDDKDKTPSPKIEKKTSIGRDVSGIRASFSRSEEDLFSDAVTEFSDSATSQGSVHKTLDRDLFYSFNDAENGGTKEVLNTPIEISKANLEVSNTLDTDVEKILETEITKVELTDTDGQRSDGSVKVEVVDPTPAQSLVSQSQEAKSVAVSVDEKTVENQNVETVTEETKNSEIIGEYDDNGKQEDFRKMESATADENVCEHVSETDKESEPVKRTEFDREIVSEVDKESKDVSIEGVSEEISYTPEVAKESEIDQNILPVNKKDDFGEPKEQILEVVNEPVTVLSEIKDLEASESEKVPKEQIQEIVEKHTDEVVEKPDSLLTESRDLGEPILDKCSEEIVVEHVPVLTESQDVIAPELEKCSKEIPYEVIEQKDNDVKIDSSKSSVAIDKMASGVAEPFVEETNEISNEVIEQKVDDVKIVLDDVNDETVTQKDSLDTSVGNEKTASVEETNSKVNNDAVFSVDSGSRNSLEANWGSVSVLSTASIDTESLQTPEKSKVNPEKSKVNPEKSTPSDTHSPPKGTDDKNTSSDVRDLKQPLTEVNNASEVRNKNEEAIAKVTNWTATGKQSTALKNLLGEAKSPSGKQLENVEKNEDNVGNEDVNSPPKLIDEGKNGKKKMKAKSSWMPFVCCSSKNVVN